MTFSRSSRSASLSTSIAFGFVLVLGTSVAAKDSVDPFARDVAPLLQRYCVECHLEGAAEGGINLDQYASQKDALEAERVWTRVLDAMQNGTMPPDEALHLPPEEREQIVAWIEQEYFPSLCAKRTSPPSTVIRRLNRQEYDNTIRDLVGLDLRPARNFPADDIGYGFDNIGSALNTSPIHVEKYLQAAEQVMDAAISIPDAENRSPAELIGLRTYPLEPGKTVEFEHQLSPGRYLVEFSLVRVGIDESVEPPTLRIGFSSDARVVRAIRVQDETVVYRFWMNVREGDRQVRVADTNPTPENEPVSVNANVSGDQRYGNQRGLHVDSMVVRGPVAWDLQSLPEAHRQLGFGDNLFGVKSRTESARELLSLFAERAFRRPIHREELDRLMMVFEAANERGESFERSMQITLTAVLVSPQFLYLVEPDDDRADRPLSEYELATRLSYFLWSTMPDRELAQAAREGSLRRDLAIHVKRMVADERSNAFVENFLGQWLLLRKLEGSTPDANLFPTFDNTLRKAMQQETEQYFAHILRTNRSVLELLDSDYTFLNGILAEHYGIDGVKGEKFRRVSLLDRDRGGVLTQASVLTLTSNPNRTSPVKRGQFLLQQILGTPPPPPPPNVPELDEGESSVDGASLRERMEIHRSNPECASCHKQMDAMGFAFEGYDAIGRRRDSDGGFPIESAGELLGGLEFEDASELRRILRSNASKQFTRCFIENMLTYALGRSIEPHDYCLVEEIRGQLSEDNYRIQRLITSIVESDAFQRRGALE